MNCKRVGYYMTNCVRSKCFSSDSAGTTLFLDDKYSPWKKPTETEEPDEFNFRSVPLFLAFVHFFKTNA